MPHMVSEKRIDMKKLEALLELGGIKKDVTLLALSGAAVICSLCGVRIGAFDPAWAAIILCGVPIVLEAVIGLVTAFDIKADVLVSLALVASVCIGEIFAAGEVAFIMQLGGLLEELTVAKARAGIEKLLHLMPQTARVVSGGEEKIIPAEEVQAGEILRVLPGESIPVDGVIISGRTSINQAVMTGESLPERETFQMVPGQGVCALVGGHTVLAGNPALPEGHGVSLLPMQAAEQAISTGSTVTYAAVDGRRGFCAGLAFLLVLRGKETAHQKISGNPPAR